MLYHNVRKEKRERGEKRLEYIIYTTTEKEYVNGVKTSGDSWNGTD